MSNLRFGPERAEMEEEIFSLYRRAAQKGSLDGTSLWDEDYPGREALREDLAGGNVFSLREGGRLLAVISVGEEEAEVSDCGVPWTAGRPWVLSRLCVEPQRQGRGLAGILMQRIIAKAREEGRTSLQILAAPANPAANRLYTGLGCLRLGLVRLFGQEFFAYEYPLSPQGPAFPAKGLGVK